MYIRSDVFDYNFCELEYDDESGDDYRLSRISSKVARIFLPFINRNCFSFMLTLFQWEIIGLVSGGLEAIESEKVLWC